MSKGSLTQIKNKLRKTLRGEHFDTLAQPPSSIKAQSSKSSSPNKVTVPRPNKASVAMAREVLKGERQKLAAEIPSHIIKRAWFCMSHLLLDDNAIIIDAGSMDGQMAYAMASLYPNKQVIGVDIDDQQIESASNAFQRDNLTYRKADLLNQFAAPSSVDAIINSFFLHDVYSESQYNTKIISRLLGEQYKALKDNGYILIRDYIVPNSNEYVMIEFKDIHNKGDDVKTMSESDLLIWYSENARSDDTQDGAGFFLEELPATYPNTRLFRLPIKWAYEFINRKDDRDTLQDELYKEYAFFTEQEFRSELRTMGMRIVYSAPHWDDGFIKTRYDGKIRLYREDGTSLGPPPTSHIILAQKIPRLRSRVVMERRSSRNKKGVIHLRSVRDERTGEITDIATRDLEIAEVLPYRIDEKGRLKIYLHENLPRGLVNAVPRAGRNIDGKSWSGHLIEAISTPITSVDQWDKLDVNQLRQQTATHIGVQASIDTEFENGPGFYPDPYRIDERIVTHYYRTESYHAPYAPRHKLVDAEGFSDLGRIREYDAQDILNAISVGLIPSPRLETQILALAEKNKVQIEVWEDMPIHLSEVKAEDVKDVDKIVKRMSVKDTRFKDIKGSAGNIRVTQSVFVDEGRDEQGGATSLAARDIEFIHADGETINTAVVMPMVRDLSGEVLAGVCAEYLPVPQRHRGSGLTMTLPSFRLPKEVTDMDSARRYIAEKFRVDAKFVARMGESYYTHIGMTPHRIFPFVISHSRMAWVSGPGGFIYLTPIKNLWKMCYWDNHDSFIKVTAMAYKNLCQDSDLSVRWDFDTKLSGDNMKSRISESSYVTGSSAQIPVTLPKAGNDATAITATAPTTTEDTPKANPAEILSPPKPKNI